ncbi:hypothetical protein HZH66_011763 [Vespula vulgaris]|uniref:Uncharacterized protein n=1 Tax=Vespula vulgaris TaxID=7454 RepID=A0A834JI59_VESVU|nr:hypothetical protein HZH66_011763 [Vespula vulgaris]
MSERKQRTKDLERKLELKIEKEWQRLVAAQQELREKREELKILQIRVNNRNADVNQNSKALRQQQNYRRKLGIEKIWRHKLALPFSAINTRRRFFGDNTLDLPDSPTSLTKKKISIWVDSRELPLIFGSSEIHKNERRRLMAVKVKSS